jgi:protein-disulfide isomerase
MSTRARSLLLAGGLAAVLVVIGVIASLGGSDEGGASAEDAEKLAAAFEGVPQRGLVAGEPNAPVRVIEFGDMQCPFCAEFAEAVPQIVDEYVKPGRIRFEFQPLDFIGPDSNTLARLVAAASLQNQAWPLIEVLFAKQGPENSGYVSDEFLDEALSAVPDLDGERALSDLQSPEVEELLVQAQDLAEDLEVNSTPTFFVQVGKGEPRPLRVSALDFESFAEALDPVLKRAEG